MQDKFQMQLHRYWLWTAFHACSCNFNTSPLMHHLIFRSANNQGTCEEYPSKVNTAILFLSMLGKYGSCPSGNCPDAGFSRVFLKSYKVGFNLHILHHQHVGMRKKMWLPLKKFWIKILNNSNNVWFRIRCYKLLIMF